MRIRIGSRFGPRHGRGRILKSDRTDRVLIIGGGVSGIASAIRLRHRGFVVTLVERSEFPREKICGCCLGAAGLAALDSIGLGQGVRQRGIVTESFVGYLQTRRRQGRFGSNGPRCRSPIRLPIQPGVAISRSVLDTYLRDAAIDAGVEVRQPHEAQVVDSNAKVVTVRHRRAGDSWTTTNEYALVIIATGLTGIFQGKPTAESYRTSPLRWELPWVESPHGPLGVATHLPGDHRLAKSWPIDDGDIQMVCGDDGYVGLVRLPGGAIDIAAALPSRTKTRSTRADLSNSPSVRIGRLLESHPDFGVNFVSDLNAWLQQDASWMTAPPLRRTRQVGRGRAVAIGDCARYVEPLTGEGMTWGIESGIAVADLCHETVSGERELDLAKQWARRLDTLQSKRRIVCRGVTSALRSRYIRRVAQFSLHRFGWLAGPLTRGLASGPKFVPTEIRRGG